MAFVDKTDAYGAAEYVLIPEWRSDNDLFQFCDQKDKELGLYFDYQIVSRCDDIYIFVTCTINTSEYTKEFDSQMIHCGCYSTVEKYKDDRYYNTEVLGWIRNWVQAKAKLMCATINGFVPSNSIEELSMKMTAEIVAEIMHKVSSFKPLTEEQAFLPKAYYVKPDALEEEDKLSKALFLAQDVFFSDVTREKLFQCSYRLASRIETLTGDSSEEGETKGDIRITLSLIK